MIWKFNFIIPGDPKALKRHRTVKIGKFTRQYDPSVEDKKDFLIKSLEHKPAIPYDEPLYLFVTFCFKRPKAHFGTGANLRKLKAWAPFWHASTPDADNLAKFVCDSYNSIFWKDDSCISEMHIRKIYGEYPCVKVKIALQSENPLE